MLRKRVIKESSTFIGLDVHKEAIIGRVGGMWRTRCITGVWPDHERPGDAEGPAGEVEAGGCEV